MLHRQRRVPQKAVGVSEPEVVRPGLGRLVEPLDAVPVPREQGEDVREAPKDLERVRLTENQGQDAPVRVLDGMAVEVPQGLLEGRERLRMGVDTRRPVGAARQVGDCLLDVLGPRVMVCEPVGALVEPVGVERLERGPAAA